MTCAIGCALALGVSACGTSGRGRRPTLNDGGVSRDAGAPGDSGSSGDSGRPPTDGGAGFDAGGSCTEPRTMCGDVCTDVTSDRANCGFCGNACPGTESCVDATCRPAMAGRVACGSPGSVPAGGGSLSVDLSTGSADGALSCGSGTPGSDRAYTWTPSSSGMATITVTGMTSTGGDFDTILAVFSSPACDSASELTCNDDSIGLGSSVSLAVTAGTRYYIVVVSYTSPTPAGTVTLNVMFGAP